MKIVVLAVLFSASASAFAQAPMLHCGQTLYVAPMPDGLDGYIRSALVKRHFPLQLVTDKKKADLTMTGESNPMKSHWYNGGVTNTFIGNITITDRSGKVVWAGAAGDRNIWWGNLAKHGPEKAAERIVGKLVKAAPKSCP